MKKLKKKSKDINHGKNFLTKQTYEAIIFTTRSTTAIIRYLLERGFQYVLTRKLSSDNIERIFSACRQFNGGMYNVDARSALFAMDKLLRTGIVLSSQHSNVGLERGKKRNYELVQHQRGSDSAYRRRTLPVLHALTGEDVKVLDELKCDPSKINTFTAIVKVMNY